MAALFALSVGKPAFSQERPAASKPKDPAALPSDKPVEVALPLTRFTLDNGLRVVLNEDRSVSTVAIAVAYDVGGRHEEKGKEGVLRVIERLFSMGSKNVAKGDHARLIASRGGTPLTHASWDRTLLLDVLPASQIVLGLWLEADRMRSLEITDDRLEEARRTLFEEQKVTSYGQVYGPSLLRLEELVFQGYFPYGHSMLGPLSEGKGPSLKAVKAFYGSYFGPNNAALVISGDFDSAAASLLVKKYFETIPKVTVPELVGSAVPAQQSPRTGVYTDNQAALPALFYGFRTPPVPRERPASSYALELCAIVLGGGETSRLDRLLVREKGVARSVTASLFLRRGPGLFQIDARLSPNTKATEAMRHIDSTLRDLAKSGPTQKELKSAQRKAQTRFLSGLRTTAQRARSLAEYELFTGDAAGLLGEPARYFDVEADEVRKAVGEHLASTRRTIVEAYPKEEPKRAPPADASQAKQGAKKPDKAPDAKSPEKGPTAKKPGKEPVTKKPEKASSAKKPEKASSAKKPARAPSAKPKKGSR